MERGRRRCLVEPYRGGQTRSARAIHGVLMRSKSIVLFRLLWILVPLHIGLTWVQAGFRGWRARQSEVPQPSPAPEELPPVSVLVPAWNERGTVERNIAALKQVEYPCWEAIILAGGEDGTHEAAQQAAAEDARFRILERGPEPKNAALNRGVGAAQHDVVVLLDCDNIVEPGWLAGLMAPIARGASVAVGGLDTKGVVVT